MKSVFSTIFYLFSCIIAISQIPYIGPEDLTEFDVSGSWGDINSDGLDDFLYISDGQLLARINNGTLTDWPEINVIDDAATSTLFVGDVDGDSDDDIIYKPSSTALWLINNENGELSTPVLWHSISSNVSLGFTDIDHDGDLDLWYGNFDNVGYEYIKFKFTPGNGGFEDTQTYYLPDYTFMARPIDANADGWPDVLFTYAVEISQTQSYKKVALGYNQGDWTYTSTELVSEVTSYPTQVEVGDFDGDAVNDDFFVWGVGFGLRSCPDGDCEDFIGSSVGNVLFEDLDNDGDDDVLCKNGSELVHYYNHEGWHQSSLANELSGIPRTGDLDGNGIPEIVIWSSTAMHYVRFTAPTTGCTDPNATNYAPWALEDDGSCIIVDLNADGDFSMEDILILMGDFGCTDQDCNGDVNGDGQTDIFDLLLILQLFPGE